MELLAAVNNTNTPVEQLEEKIVRDVSLSFKLLKLINSSFFGMPKKVDSVKRAIVLLGRDEIRKLVSLLALSGNGDRPSATIEIALIRARLCELLGQRSGSSETFFTVGMFSALDILMEQPIHRILAKLPLSDEVRAAILRKEGIMGQALRCTLAVENARWSEIGFPGLDTKGLAALYRQAVRWSHEVISHL
jgi:EAL and modified HD-GYP domain-containing signal transduction protein